jgi:hypothetical protein
MKRIILGSRLFNLQSHDFGTIPVDPPDDAMTGAAFQAEASLNKQATPPPK